MVCLNPLQQELKKAEWPNRQNDNVVETDFLFHILQCFLSQVVWKNAFSWRFPVLFELPISPVRVAFKSSNSSRLTMDLWSWKNAQHVHGNISQCPNKIYESKETLSHVIKIGKYEHNLLTRMTWPSGGLHCLHSQQFPAFFHVVQLFALILLPWSSKNKTMTGSHAMSWRRFFGAIPPLKKNWWVELRSAHSFCQEPFSTI